MFRTLTLSILTAALTLAACAKPVTTPSMTPSTQPAAPIALVIVLDKSGSMGAPAAGQTKMDFANLAVLQAVQLLSPTDYAQIAVVDTEVHWITAPNLVPLTPANASNLKSQTLAVNAFGGGIYAKTALTHAYQLISDPSNPATIRHIILFADTADTEQQEDCLRMADEFAHHTPPITLSVIGLGNALDQDTPFQMALARAGHGRSMQTVDAQTLPSLFARDVSALLALRPASLK